MTPQFIKNEEWSPQDPDCNPMNYVKWDSLKEKAYQGLNEEVIELALKNRTIMPWKKISIDEIRKSISV